MRGRLKPLRVVAVAALVACLTLAVTGHAGKGKLEVNRYKVGFDPIDVAVGDFDRDGRKDLVLTNFQSASDGAPKSLSILRGRSKGRFKRAKTIVLPGDQPHGISVTRLGKGKDQDLVVGTFGDNILLFKGRKRARFRPPVELAIGDQPRQVATGDFNRDGLTDIAASRQDGEDVAVMLGEGGLGFGAPSFYPGASGSQILATNLDPGGDLDLVTIDHGIDSIAVFRGQAGGSFGAAEPLATPTEPFSVAVADLNRDGRRDVIAGLVGNRPRLAVARGLPGGTFAAPATLTVGPRPMVIEDIEVTKLNRDRDSDLVLVGTEAEGVRASRPAARGIGDPGPSSRVLFLRGRGGIKLDRAREVTFSGFANAVAAGRFDGDGRDVAVARGRPEKRGHAVVVRNP